LMIRSWLPVPRLNSTRWFGRVSNLLLGGGPSDRAGRQAAAYRSALKHLEHSKAFLVAVWRAIRPHMPAVQAHEPSRNSRVQVFDALKVAFRALGTRRLGGVQGHDRCWGRPPLHEISTRTDTAHFRNPQSRRARRHFQRVVYALSAR
jgi:hypothetical protein